MATAAEFLAVSPPTQRSGHTMQPLTDWFPLTPAIDNAASVARLAWGYAINCSVEPTTNLASTSNPIRQNIDYAAAHPGVPVQANLYRPLGYTAYTDTLPETAWATNPATGARLFSPVAPQSVLDAAGEATAEQIARITAFGVTPTIMLHGAETGLKSYNNMGNTLNDPAVLAWLNREGEGTAYTNRTQAPAALWSRLISEAKARENAPQVDLALAKAPGAQHIYYTSMGPQKGLNDTMWSNEFDWRYMKRLTRYPGPELYYGNSLIDSHPNGKWVQGAHSYNYDLLTVATNCIGQALSTGHRLMYPFISGGWSTDNAMYISDDARWEGFLKCLYTLGCVGACYGYFKTGVTFTGDLGTTAPVWLRHMQVLGRVHSLFTYMEEYLRGGTLLAGTDNHAFGDGQPAYEYATGTTNARCIVRKRDGQQRYLVACWSADGIQRRITVSLPSGDHSLLFPATGRVYKISYVSGAWRQEVAG